MRTIYSLMVMALLLGCKGNTEAPVKTPPSQTKTAKEAISSKDLNQTSTASEVIFENEKFTQIYNAYLDVKASLVNTNEAESAVKTRALFMLLKGNEAYTPIFNATLPFMETTSIKQTRAVFEEVSKEMEAQIAKEKILSGTIYKQYCPMAFSGKGAYWLSDSKEVRNPYFGDQMLKCGVVDREIE